MRALAVVTKTEDSQSSELLDGGAATPRGRLAALVLQILKENSIARSTISSTAQLSELGLSSLDMVRLMLAVEAEFGVAIPSSEITPSNFHSVASIEALLARISAR
jgi:acyl carrier protein